jgi:T5orf172 domain
MKALYIMLAPSLPYRHKIGIAKNAEKRRKQVDKTVRGAVYRVWLVIPPNAKRMETAAHRIFAVWNAPIKKRGDKTNGETEWFLTVNFVTGFGLYLFAPSAWWVALLPLPFDAVVLVTALTLWAWAWRLVAAGLVVYLLYSTKY